MKYINVILPKSLPDEIFESQVKAKFSNQNVRYFSINTNSKGINGLTVYPIKAIEKKGNVYVRTVFDFLYLFILNLILNKKLYIIFDFRGLISEESFLRNNSYYKRNILGFFERFAYKNSAEIWTVSYNLKSELLRRFYVREIKVIPCKTKRENVVLKRLLAKDKINFVYLGSLNIWQCFERVCEVYKKLEEEKTHLTIVTREVGKAKEVVSKYGIQNFCIKSCNAQEVLHELDKADFGFILREDNYVNTTSSPIKLVEYTSRGVVPIMTPYVGDYSKELCHNGIVLEPGHGDVDLRELEVKLTQENFDFFYEWSKGYSW